MSPQHTEHLKDSLLRQLGHSRRHMHVSRTPTHLLFSRDSDARDRALRCLTRCVKPSRSQSHSSAAQPSTASSSIALDLGECTASLRSPATLPTASGSLCVACARAVSEGADCRWGPQWCALAHLLKNSFQVVHTVWGASPGSVRLDLTSMGPCLSCARFCTISICMASEHGALVQCRARNLSISRLPMLAL